MTLGLLRRGGGTPGDIPLRVHQQVELADRGALRAQRDWERAVGPLPRYAGIMSRDYNFVATCLPEGLPDRIELSAYVTETAFLLDDAIDAAESPLAAAAPFMADLFQARLELKKPLDTDISGCTPVVKLVVGMGRAMLADGYRDGEARVSVGEEVGDPVHVASG